MHEPNIDRLKHELTYEQWCKWEQFYEQDPWGESRQDMRSMAMLLTQWVKDTETSMIWPYWESDEDAAETFREGQKLLAELGTERIQEALKRGREKHLVEKAKREQEVNG